MTRRSGTVLTWVGAAMTVVGFVGTVVFIAQPWRSCPYDDSPAGCVALPGDVAALGVFMIAAVVGLLVTGWGLIVRFTAAR